MLNYLSVLLESINMQNEAGEYVDMYTPRKWYDFQSFYNMNTIQLLDI